MNKNTKVLALKYRPQSFEDLIGQDIASETIINSIKANKVPNAYLFTGIRGIGKTTILRTIAGLEKLENGEIILKDKIISSTNENLEPEKRKIALSFQENSLFPHHSIYKNIILGIPKSGSKKINA